MRSITIYSDTNDQSRVLKQYYALASLDQIIAGAKVKAMQLSKQSVLVYIHNDAGGLEYDLTISIT